MTKTRYPARWTPCKASSPSSLFSCSLTTWRYWGFDHHHYHHHHVFFHHHVFCFHLSYHIVVLRCQSLSSLCACASCLQGMQRRLSAEFGQISHCGVTFNNSAKFKHILPIIYFCMCYIPNPVFQIYLVKSVTVEWPMLPTYWTLDLFL